MLTTFARDHAAQFVELGFVLPAEFGMLNAFPFQAAHARCQAHYMASMRAGTRLAFGQPPQFLTPLKEEFCTPHSRNKELPPLHCSVRHALAK